MRPDMFRVIIESGRHGGHNDRNATKPRRVGDWDAYHSHESMRLPHKDRKEQSDRFSVMRRYMRAQVGRPWDLIWSEICRSISGRHVLGFHLRTHMGQDIVERNICIINGVPHELKRFGRGWNELNHGDLYVHPETGLLCWYKKGEARRWRYRKPTDPTLKKISDVETLKWEKGVWYRYTFVPLPPGVEGPPPHTKKQLNKRELRAHGLR